MSLAKTIVLTHTGYAAEIPAYISLQNVVVQQRKDGDRSYWFAQANVHAYISREAKYDGLQPIETSFVECECDPRDVFGSLYSALKNEPRFAGAKDV